MNSLGCMSDLTTTLEADSNAASGYWPCRKEVEPLLLEPVLHLTPGTVQLFVYSLWGILQYRKAGDNEAEITSFLKMFRPADYTFVMSSALLCMVGP